MAEFGFKSALEALRQLDEAHQEKLLADIAKKKPELAAALKSALFQFEDLSDVNDRGFQVLWGKVPENTWLMAFRKANNSLWIKLRSCVSDRVYLRFKQQFEESGPQPMRKVIEAQQEIMQVAEQLKSSGHLVVVTDNDDPLV